MKGIHEYIVEILEPFKETYITEGGLTLYANKDFSADKLSNRIGIVKETPFELDSVIEKNDEVLIDPTILYEQIYRGIKQESIHLLDRDKMLFKIAPNLIVLYRKPNQEWKGFLKNCLVCPIKKIDEKPKTSSLILLEEVAEKYEKGKAIMKYTNSDLLENDINNGDTVAIDKMGGVSFWLDSIEHHWIRNIDVLGKYEKQ